MEICAMSYPIEWNTVIIPPFGRNSISIFNILQKQKYVYAENTNTMMQFGCILIGGACLLEGRSTPPSFSASTPLPSLVSSSPLVTFNLKTHSTPTSPGPRSPACRRSASCDSAAAPRHPPPPCVLRAAGHRRRRR